eukprot:TRINITY_DN12284_c0_g1_i1.p1 TRINITY_DN12284_c0_g1~~TRINITY_DN12284_c0_g1_i1.p1  ORF type:complete len:878 (-),score=138.00 TRINITY_DN12284_c0_g1_i1:99-2732(-)
MPPKVAGPPGPVPKPGPGRPPQGAPSRRAPPGGPPPRGPPPGTPPMAGRPTSPPVRSPMGAPPVGSPLGSPVGVPGSPLASPLGSPMTPGVLPAFFTDQETLNRQFEQFDQSHQSVRDFFLREDQLLGLERRKFEEWKQAQQAWLDKQNLEIADRQGETKRYEEELHQLERDIQSRERAVQKQQQGFQANQRQLQLAQQQHAQQMQQNLKLIKQQQDQMAAAQQNQAQQQGQLAHQEHQQAITDQQLGQQRVQQMYDRDRLATQAAQNQQAAQALQVQAQQVQSARAKENATFQPLLKANSQLTPLTGAVPGTVFGGRPFNPGPIHTYLQDREEPKSPFIRQQVGMMKWTDPDFRPDNSSLFFGQEPSPNEWGGAWGSQWIRATELFPQAGLFKGDDGGPSGADIIQGALGDMWFLNALSCVATNPNIVRNLVVAQYPEVGIFEFRFWKGGRWITVVIDDFLPVRQLNGQGTSLGSSSESFQAGTCELWCSRSSDPSELWVPLLEKAYAKLHGSYQALNGGNTEYAMVDLTGGAAEHIALNTEGGRALMRCGGVQEKLKQAKAEGWLVGCVFKGTPSTGQFYSPGENGLIPGRTYVMLDVRDTPQGNTTLIRMRNPWGVGGWNGPWSNGEAMWPAAELGNNLSTFWMELQQFEDNLAALQICRTYNYNIGDPWYMSADLDGYWGGMNAGGQVSMSNPQYIVSAPEDAAAFVYLSQYDVPYQRQDRDCDVAPAYRKPHFPDPNPNVCCGVFILQCDSHTRMNNPTGNVLTKDIVKYATFVYGRQTGVEFRLDPGRSLCLMACQFQAGVESPYQLYVYSTKPFAMRKTLGEGAEQPMPVFTIQFSAPPPGLRWDPGFRARVIVERQPKGEVLEEDVEKR